MKWWHLSQYRQAYILNTLYRHDDPRKDDTELKALVWWLLTRVIPFGIVWVGYYWVMGQ